jgi:omega-6 fatty acid desaturase (delta-12 desaturase)
LTTTARLKQINGEIVRRYAMADDRKGAMQVLLCVVPLTLLWWAAAVSANISSWFTVVFIALISLFDLQCFALMHDCGHGSLFSEPRRNQAAGFLFGVLAGMPQYVWSKHHNFHHATNGNWEKYRGPLGTLSCDEYAALSVGQQRRYCRMRHLVVAPLGGFLYLLFNPRYTWLKGSVTALYFIARAKLRRSEVSLAQHAAAFQTPYWKSGREYVHMFWNNVVLLGLWVLMCWLMGPLHFFVIYTISLSLAGAAGIVLFTVQHNFEHSYASDSARNDDEVAVLSGTSFLVLPQWLNWFTANIAYHHVHHLSASIPNYRLVACHNEYDDAFTEVKRIKLSAIRPALKCILWDRERQCIISVAELERRGAATV